MPCRHHFPDEPPQFLERAPYGYHDRAAIVGDLRAGGFDREPVIEHVEVVTRASTPLHVAAAFCGGTPLRDDLDGRGPGHLADAIGAAAAAISAQFGAADPEGRISAQFGTITR